STGREVAALPVVEARREARRVVESRDARTAARDAAAARIVDGRTELRAVLLHHERDGRGAAHFESKDVSVGPCHARAACEVGERARIRTVKAVGDCSRAVAEDLQLVCRKGARRAPDCDTDPGWVDGI